MYACMCATSCTTVTTGQQVAHTQTYVCMYVCRHKISAFAQQQQVAVDQQARLAASNKRTIKVDVLHASGQARTACGCIICAPVDAIVSVLGKRKRDFLVTTAVTIVEARKVLAVRGSSSNILVYATSLPAAAAERVKTGYA